MKSKEAVNQGKGGYGMGKARLTEREERLLAAVEFLLDYARRVSQGQVRQEDWKKIADIRRLVNNIKNGGEENGE